MADVEEDYRSALKRLLSGHPERKHEREDDGLIRISIKSVAYEAQRARTTIATVHGPYPKTRELILRVMRRVERCKNQHYRGPRDFKDTELRQRHSLVRINADLRKRNAELNEQIDMFATLLAEADQQLRLYQKGDDRAAEASERKASRAHRMKNRR